MNLFKLFEDAAKAAVKPRGRISKRNPQRRRITPYWGVPRIRLPAPFQSNICGTRVEKGVLIDRKLGHEIKEI
jgi:hypothetical protein